MKTKELFSEALVQVGSTAVQKAFRRAEKYLYKTFSSFLMAMNRDTDLLQEQQFNVLNI